MGLPSRDEMTDEGRRMEDVFIRTLGATLEEYERYVMQDEPMPLSVRLKWRWRSLRDVLRWK
jgi:hypothetical protein